MKSQLISYSDLNPERFRHSVLKPVKRISDRIQTSIGRGQPLLRSSISRCSNRFIKMYLSTKDQDKLLLTTTGLLAQRRLARGVRLNLSEATALIACVLQELIRDGQSSVSQLMQVGKEILGFRHVQASVPGLLHEVQVEGTLHVSPLFVSNSLPSLSSLTVSCMIELN